MKWVSLLLLAIYSASAQEVLLQTPEERRETREQSQRVFDVVAPVTLRASASTVWVWSNRKQVAMGTVVGDGTQVLTKWSEIAFSRTPVQIVGGDSRQSEAEVIGVYEDDDLALLQLKDESVKFAPVAWGDSNELEVGSFMVAAGPDDRPLSLGVVAVAERTLRDSDQAFIGIQVDPEHAGEGVRIQQVVDQGGAREAGIQNGDIMLSINDETISNGFELRNVLLDYAPGDVISVKLKRDGQIMDVSVTLTGRPSFPGVPESRLRVMRSMGTELSMVRTNFPVVVQTDMQLMPHQCGGPIVNLDGEVIGLSISRTDRTRSYILPASRMSALLEQAPVDPALAEKPKSMAQMRAANRPEGSAPRPRVVPLQRDSAERFKQHLEEMSELLKRMDREMRGLEE